MRITQVNVRLHFRIAKAENRKMRLIHVQAFLADILDLLRNAVRIPVSRIKILLREIAVFVQRLSVTENDPLSVLSVHTQFRVSRKILSEIYDRTSVRRLYKFSFKTLLLNDRHALRRLQIVISVIFDSHTVPAGDVLQPRIVSFTLLEVIYPYGAVLTRIPASVTDEYRLTADFELAQQCQI